MSLIFVVLICAQNVTLASVLLSTVKCILLESLNIFRTCSFLTQATVAIMYHQITTKSSSSEVINTTSTISYISHDNSITVRESGTQHGHDTNHVTLCRVLQRWLREHS